ncbi:MAG: efflux RND transporter periplasmic adaptor subunit [Acidobacteria bacterium]|nr:efflux RND transporter periplasmic adaptor subunit [Acidobacteriota bacterium]
MKKKILIPIVAVVAVGVTVAFSLRKGHDEGVTVQVEPVQRRTIVHKVNATGKIQPRTQVKISADVSAKITRLDVKEGDWVEKGTLLFELDRERYVAEVESAEANLRAAQSQTNLVRENMNKARKDYERTEQLYRQHLEPQATLDAAYAAAEVEKARYQSAVDQAEQSKAALKQARDALSKTTIYAPMSGTISKLNKEVGEMALGSQFQADVVLELSNLAGMEALVNVDENDIVRVALGNTAEIEVDAIPNVVFHGEVTEIANSANITGAGTTEQKTEFEVKVAVTDPTPALRPGMTASADIVTDTHEDALSVPIQSVAVRTLDQLKVAKKAGAAAEGAPGAKAGDETPAATAEEELPRFVADKEGFVPIVWLVDNGKARARQVKTGIQGETHIEILDGLKAGETVVVGNFRAISRDLEDGTVVRTETDKKDKKG